MGEKSAQKRKYIVETARGVFVEKGYKDVTMKDIVDACKISRGGLYLYFASTEEIFMDVLKMGRRRRMMFLPERSGRTHRLPIFWHCF